MSSGPTTLGAPPPADSGTIHLRQFTRADIPAVVAIRYQAFQQTARPSPADLGAFLARTFLDNPWRDLDLPSLVHLDEAGEVNGFVGVVPRRMRFEGRTLRVAVPTQLMMRPGAAPGSGLRLARATFEGPQDLMISDVANEAARRLWERVGGYTSLLHSLFWVLPLQRTRYHLGRFASGPVTRGLAYLARPVGRLLDRIAPTPLFRAAPNLRIERFDPVRDLALLEEVGETWSLRPEYDAAGLAWQLDEVRRKEGQGPLEGWAVRDARGLGVGWFLYFANRGGIGEVVVLAARPGDYPKVLGALIGVARDAGVVALAGRMDPPTVEALTACNVRLDRNGPWFLTHARDPAVATAVLRGGAFLSRLEGEWWLNF